MSTLHYSTLCSLYAIHCKLNSTLYSTLVQYCTVHLYSTVQYTCTVVYSTLVQYCTVHLYSTVQYTCTVKTVNCTLSPMYRLATSNCTLHLILATPMMAFYKHCNYHIVFSWGSVYHLPIFLPQSQAGMSTDMNVFEPIFIFNDYK